MQKTARHDFHLGIVCPMANESGNVRQFIPAVLAECRGFAKVSFFAVLDNKSTDGTLGVVRAMEPQFPQLVVVWAPENRCVVDAYVKGYREALAGGCDWILEIDAGFSHQPPQIPQFFETMSQGYDCVFGSRFCKGGRYTDANLKRFVISRGGSILTNLLLGTKLKDMTSGFELFSAEALRMVLDKGIRSRGHFFQTEIKAFCRGPRITEVPITFSCPSSNVNSAILRDAIVNLWRLFGMRLRGTL